MSDPLPPPATPPAKTQERRERLLSLDALRGFDMFWIVGGEEVFSALARAWPIDPLVVLGHQLNHSEWEGFTFYDLIFPLFVFLAGVALVFALGRFMEQHGKLATLRHVLVRSLLLYAVGLFFYGGISKGLHHVRWVGVLQTIAISYFFAGVIFCTSRARGMVAICVALLLGYWGVTALVPIRDFNLEREHLKSIGLTPDSAETVAQFRATTATVSNRFEDGLNLPHHFDYEYLPGRRWDGAYDPEGWLSTFPAIVTCLFGVFAGMLLKSDSLSGQRKVWSLLAAGVVAVALGYLWGMQFPIIKRIWTSSFVLVAGGYSCLLLGVFYQVVEIWNLKSWCVPFVWIGMNPISIYLAFNLFHFDELAKRVVGGPIQEGLGVWGDLLHALVVVGMTLAVVRFLYQRKIFFRL